MNTSKIISCFSLAVLIFLLSSCRHNQYKVNISGIKADVKITRLENDLFDTSPDKLTSSLPDLKRKYGKFLQLFSLVINGGDINSQDFGEYLLKFCSDKQNFEVYNEVRKAYPDLNKIQEELNEAFRYYRYYFPDKNVPSVYSCITGFNNSIITGDSCLGFGLDRYLGADSKYYKELNIYRYMTARMTSENITTDCIYGWAASEWDFASIKYPVDNVLAEIIHEGKLKYFERCMLPEKSEELTFGFTAAQMKFCRDNEANMWQTLIEKNLLFNTGQMTIKKLTGDAPFTSFFSNDSPGRAAVWTGFRIVESYMSKNKSVSLKDLMSDTDVQGILEKARYNP